MRKLLKAMVREAFEITLRNKDTYNDDFSLISQVCV